jgi:hypothetical protein
LKPWIFEHLAVTRFGARQFEQFLVGFEYDDARARPDSSAEYFACVSQPPSEMENHIRLFEP